LLQDPFYDFDKIILIVDQIEIQNLSHEKTEDFEQILADEEFVFEERDVPEECFLHQDVFQIK